MTAHIPVLLDEVKTALAPIPGANILDGTLGAGGYTRAILEAGAACVIALDRDPRAVADAQAWAKNYQTRLAIFNENFSDLDRVAARHGIAGLDGVVLDIGVSSMQIDQSERGFSFMRDGPLDMRMGDSGPSAQTLVNDASERMLADIFYHYGEERAARRIAGAIVTARTRAPITRTTELAEIIARTQPRKKSAPGQIHPATRCFQALRIAVNDELGALARGLAAAERALLPGGRLAVVTFHSLEDRIVKRFLQNAAGTGGQGSRHAPGPMHRLPPPSFARPKRAVTPRDDEIRNNPRARSARLRSAVRTDAPPIGADPATLGLAQLPNPPLNLNARGAP